MMVIHYIFPGLPFQFSVSAAHLKYVKRLWCSRHPLDNDPIISPPSLDIFRKSDMNIINNKITHLFLVWLTDWLTWQRNNCVDVAIYCNILIPIRDLCDSLQFMEPPSHLKPWIGTWVGWIVWQKRRRVAKAPQVCFTKVWHSDYILANLRIIMRGRMNKNLIRIKSDMTELTLNLNLNC